MRKVFIISAVIAGGLLIPVSAVSAGAFFG